MTDRKPEKRGLGRGLSALMADIRVEPGDGLSAARRPDSQVPVDRLIPNPLQPRRDFPAEALQDLAASIRQKGVIQPLIVRPAPDGSGSYEIVAGERRWRAAQIAQLHDVPVVIRSFDDTEVLEVAIIENIQRSDLNAIEEAAAYRQLMDRFGHTQERLAEALSKSRSHIANLLRLLSLPDEVQNDVREGRLTAGHARALITTGDPAKLAREVIARGLSVRDTENLVRKAGSPAQRSSRPGRPVEKDADTLALEADLSAAIEMGVSISHEPGTGRGKLTVTYNSFDDLDFLCQALAVAKRDLV